MLKKIPFNHEILLVFLELFIFGLMGYFIFANWDIYTSFITGDFSVNYNLIWLSAKVIALFIVGHWLIPFIISKLFPSHTLWFRQLSSVYIEFRKIIDVTIRMILFAVAITFVGFHSGYTVDILLSVCLASVFLAIFTVITQALVIYSYIINSVDYEKYNNCNN